MISQTETLFGYARADLLGELVEGLVPSRFRSRHPQYRAGYLAKPRTRPMGAGIDLFGLRSDGTEVPAEILLSSIDSPEGRMSIATIRDVTAIRAAAHKFEQFLEFAPN